MEWSWRDGRDRVVVARGPDWARPRRFSSPAEAEGFVRWTLGFPDGRRALLAALGAGPCPPDLGEDALATALARLLADGRVTLWQVNEAPVLPLPIGADDAEPPPASAGGGGGGADPAPVGDSAMIAMLVEAARTATAFCQECADAAARSAR